MSAIECLQARTEGLWKQIEWLKAAREADSQVVLEHLRQLWAELSYCENVLSDPALASAEAAGQRARSKYRHCLQRLQEALSILQSDLSSYHSQLLPQLQHLDAASGWTYCSKSTLE